MKECLICRGVGRIQKPLKRAWWQVLLQYPGTTDERCLECFGSGVVPSTKEERDRAERARRLPASPLRPALTRLPSQISVKPKKDVRKVRVISDTPNGVEYYINCGCGKSGFRSFDPNDICGSCKIEARRARYAARVRATEKSGHKGPWCRFCGARYASYDVLPKRTTMYNETYPYCPECNSEDVRS